MYLWGARLYGVECIELRMVKRKREKMKQYGMHTDLGRVEREKRDVFV